MCESSYRKSFRFLIALKYFLTLPGEEYNKPVFLFERLQTFRHFPIHAPADLKRFYTESSPPEGKPVWVFIT